MHGLDRVGDWVVDGGLILFPLFGGWSRPHADLANGEALGPRLLGRFFFWGTFFVWVFGIGVGRSDRCIY